MVVDVALPKRQGERELIADGENLRVANPVACIESCASASEQDFLWRFFEASDFVAGNVRVYDDNGDPLGRYEDYAEKVDAASYVKFEIGAYDWVRRYGLGKEWATIAEMFIRMMSGRTETGIVDWGVFLTNCDDEKVAWGGAQVSMRMLGLRLKDAYRDFFRWYEAVRKTEEGGKKATPREALRELERNAKYEGWIKDFKTERGVQG